MTEVVARPHVQNSIELAIDFPRFTCCPRNAPSDRLQSPAPFCFDAALGAIVPRLRELFQRAHSNRQTPVFAGISVGVSQDSAGIGWIFSPTIKLYTGKPD